MIPGTWLAFSCAAFVVLGFVLELLGRRVFGAVSRQYQAAMVVAQWAALGFGLGACLALVVRLFS